MSSLSTVVIDSAREDSSAEVWINVVRTRNVPCCLIKMLENLEYPKGTRQGCFRAIVSTWFRGTSCTESKTFWPVSMPDSIETWSPLGASIFRREAAGNPINSREHRQLALSRLALSQAVPFRKEDILFPGCEAMLVVKLLICATGEQFISATAIDAASRVDMRDNVGVISPSFA